jgi:hypothetical protein
MTEANSIYSEAVLYFEGDTLIALYGDNKSAQLELNSDEKVVVQTVLADPNMWASFFGSLSASLTKHR